MTTRALLCRCLLPLLPAAACTGTIDGGAAPDAGGDDPTADARPGDPMIDAGGPTPDAPPIIAPGDPGPVDVSFTIDSSRAVHPISRFVYGHNGPDWDGRGARLTMGRAGGNRWTAYNWENNASNAGSDWYFQNDGYLGGGDVPGEAVRPRVAEAHAHDASYLVTVPIAGHVAADKNGDGDVAATPDYLDARFERSHARKGAGFVTAPDRGDDSVYQDEFVAWLEGSFPYARTDANRTLFYDLDNEPDLWADTHERIHPEPARYDELCDLNIEYAGAIKDVAPDAKVFGFVSYGWAGYTSLQDAPDAAGRDFIDTYLDAMAAADAAAGRRLVDVLDLHWYPEARGGGVRIVDDDASAAVAAARVQAPRSLWDPGYTEESWITMWSTEGPIRLIPRLREQIAAHDPGIELAFSEYYYGGGAHISGGVAQADVLGIFGREDVFAAALWHIGGTDDRFIYGGFDMYRDYDGEGGAFGDVSVRAETDDVAGTSVYASYDQAAYGRMVVVAINKTGAAQTAGLTVSHGVEFATAEVYRLTSAAPAPVRGADVTITEVNAFAIELPAMSVTTLVLR
jgi:hypothetical protein